MHPSARRWIVFSGRPSVSQLYEVKVNDPLALGGATLLLLACALMAGLIPARRPDRGLAHGIASSSVPRLWLSAPGVSCVLKNLRRRGKGKVAGISLLKHRRLN